VPDGPLAPGHGEFRILAHECVNGSSRRIAIIVETMHQRRQRKIPAAVRIQTESGIKQITGTPHPGTPLRDHTGWLVRPKYAQPTGREPFSACERGNDDVTEQPHAGSSPAMPVTPVTTLRGDPD